MFSIRLGRMGTGSMQEVFRLHSQELIRATAGLAGFYLQVEAVVHLIRAVAASTGKILVAGNGGSAAEAQHLTDELVGRYRANRRPFPAIALTADAMVLTCIGNDYGFDQVFRRQIEALGRPGDVFVGLTTSGSSPNILLAAEEARKRDLKVVAFTGLKGPFKDLADLAVTAPSEKAAIVQELHLHAIHLICEALEPED